LFVYRVPSLPSPSFPSFPFLYLFSFIPNLSFSILFVVEDRFKAWLAPKQNDFLHVDGYYGGLEIRKTSPLSFFCASLAVAMTQEPIFISLAYFCGEHFSSLNPLSGPPGLLRSLIV
jgi:hypothetical protein